MGGLDDEQDESAAKNHKASAAAQEDDDQPSKRKITEVFLLKRLVQEDHLKRLEDNPLEWETLPFNGDWDYKPVSEAIARICRYSGLHDYHGRVDINTAIKIARKQLEPKGWKIGKMRGLIDLLIGGADRLRYNIGRPKAGGQITDIRAV